MVSHQNVKMEWSSAKTRQNAITRLESSATPLVKQTAHLPPGWPESAKDIKASAVSALSDLLVDIVLFALSLAFIFGIVVRSYDQVRYYNTHV